MADEPRRRPLARLVRHFVLHPGAFFGWLAALLARRRPHPPGPDRCAVHPGLSQLRGSSAPVATEEYLRGNRDYNADLVWSSLNTDAQSRLQSRGGSLEDLQRQMEAARQQGIRLEEISYIGSKSLPGRHEHAVLSGRHPPTGEIRY